MRRFCDNEAEDVQTKLQGEIEEAVIDAIARLRRCARGEEHFVSDHEFRACLALTRMLQLVIVESKPAPPLRRLSHPDNSDEETAQLIRNLKYGRNAS
jgi:hypothetical protein